jgi:2-oxoglutarate ferredoxin oxidoreductase subunit alpha
MGEAIGFAACAEVPVVLVDVQRPGPSTHLPTRTAQGDLHFVMHASQGEFLRVVLTPGDYQELFDAGALALNLAEEFQIPVIILSDKFIADSMSSVTPFDAGAVRITRGKLMTQSELDQATAGGPYKRYLITPDGISPRALPGMPKGWHRATSYEHDEECYSLEDEATVNGQMTKRRAKLAALTLAVPPPVAWGPRDAPTVVVCWGSTKLIVQEAMALLEGGNPPLRAVHVRCPLPLNVAALEECLAGATRVLIVENNQTGQLADVLQEQLCRPFPHRINKFDGRQFFPEELARLLQEAAQ